VLTITKTADDLYFGTMTSLDQGGVKIPLDKIEQTGAVVRIGVKAVNGAFQGTLSPDRTKMTGTWTQGSALPLEFTRTAAAARTNPPGAPAAPATGASSPFGLPLELVVPVAPSPFPGGGKTHLVYELHITNFGSVDRLLSKLEVLSGPTVVAAHEGVE